MAFGEVRMIRLVVALVACGWLGGCAVAALPFRVGAEVVRIVPVVGPVAAAPLEAAGDVID